jgi:hypothetical protein
VNGSDSETGWKRYRPIKFGDSNMNIEIQELIEKNCYDAITKQIHFQFDDMVQQLGGELKGIYNTRFSRLFRETLNPCCTKNAVGHYEIDASKLHTFASIAAKQQAQALIAKINAKVNELESPEIHHVSGFDFSISGYRSGHKVLIKQNMIVNVSTKGRLFNQFPARIYLDGKPISAYDYNKLFT